MIVSENKAHANVPILPDFKRLSQIGGGYYTDEETQRIYNACVEAAKFMESYGIGSEPYTIDLSHYANSNPKNNGTERLASDRNVRP